MGIAANDKSGNGLTGQLVELQQRIARLEVQYAESMKSEDALRRSLAQLQTWEETAPVIICRSDLKAVVIYVNRKFEEVTGYSREEVIGKPWFMLGALSPRNTKQLLGRIRQKIAGKPPEPMELKLRRQDGKWIWVSGVGEVIREQGKPVGFQVVAQDITDRKKGEKTITRLAYYDEITNLPNRRLLNDRVSQAIAQADRDKHELAVMLLDLDNFKDINDLLGHEMGDVLLKSVAKRLLGSMRKSDTIARMGGDEFVVLLPRTSRADSAEKVAQKIADILQQPFLLGDRQVQVTISIGIAVYPDHGSKAGDLLKNADIAMYRVKRRGRNGYQVFSAGE